jgi:hypothetical protein
LEQWKPYGWPKVLLASSAVTAFTYHLASGDGTGNTDWLLSTLFATSHPIASVTGCFTKSPLFTNLQGWIFLAATLDGIVELMFCESFLKQYGGHIFHDLFLHGCHCVTSSLSERSDQAKRRTNFRDKWNSYRTKVSIL